MATLEWYYAKDNKQHGPVSAAELKQLADRGQLRPGDLVWREGMEEWTAAKKVKGLFEESSPAAPPKPIEALPPKPVEALPRPSPPGGAPTAFEKSEAAFERSRRRPARHVFDLVLEFARGQFTTQFVNLTTKMFTLAGHYGLYVAMGVLLVFGLFLGVKAGQVNTALLAVAALLILLVLQYAATRFFGALERLNRSTPGRMLSTALLDCFALLHMFGGLVALLGLTVLAVQTGWFSLILPAIAAFILCQYVAVLALNPETLSLTISSEVTAGEEAIGVLSFLVKFSLRIVPVAFGVGVVWGTLSLMYACFLVLMPPDDPERIAELSGPVAMLAATAFSDSPPSEEVMKMLPAQASAIKASVILVTSAALPFLTYVLFLVYYLVIDVLRAILSLPGKLDKTRKD